jgi:hypothetical protein
LAASAFRALQTNSKSRNPKLETNPKSKFQSHAQQTLDWNFVLLGLRYVSSFVFRVSDFLGNAQQAVYMRILHDPAAKFKGAGRRICCAVGSESPPLLGSGRLERQTATAPMSDA